MALDLIVQHVHSQLEKVRLLSSRGGCWETVERLCGCSSRWKSSGNPHHRGKKYLSRLKTNKSKFIIS